MKHITPEIAILLKEKGFSWECREFYTKSKPKEKLYITTGIEYDSDRDCIWDWNLNGGRSGMLSKEIPYPNNENQIYYSAPTISDVVDWIYEKHGIWISVSCDCGADNLFVYKIFSTKIGEEKCLLNDVDFDNPTKAYLSAIEYTLNNLI